MSHRAAAGKGDRNARVGEGPRGGGAGVLRVGGRGKLLLWGLKGCGANETWLWELKDEWGRWVGGTHRTAVLRYSEGLCGMAIHFVGCGDQRGGLGAGARCPG